MALWFAGAATNDFHRTVDDTSRCKRLVLLDRARDQRASCTGNIETSTEYPASGRRRVRAEPRSILYFPPEREEAPLSAGGRRHVTPPRQSVRAAGEAFASASPPPPPPPPPPPDAPFAFDGHDTPKAAYRGQKRRLAVPVAALRDDLDQQQLEQQRRARTPPARGGHVGAAAVPARRVNEESTSEGKAIIFRSNPGSNGAMTMLTRDGKLKIDFEAHVRERREHLRAMQDVKKKQRALEQIERDAAIAARAESPRRQGRNRACTPPPSAYRTPYAVNLAVPHTDVGRPARPRWVR